MTQSQNSHWAELFDQALKIISQVNSKFPVLDSWSFGGGTALMLQIGHRESFDVDIFIDDPQVLSYLNPQTQGFALDLYPDAYTFDGTHALKIVFKDIGEVDFIVATHLTSEPTREREIRGQRVHLETPAEIVAKKIFYRGGLMQPRDMFDIACVRESEGHDYLVKALIPFKDSCTRALKTARVMDARLAEAVMSKLLYQSKYSRIPSQAQQVTIEILEAVCGYEPTTEV
ncbi:nucleotidyl transferase AbiEii/AbiGii toxin family protein [Rhizobium sp. CNPSo 4039]|uniref:nucleotidyl transferase AbiEii/AbiGii toxin family protein n=1 Tax=Rhizobium sp. CNPSo 4039 TaxID=3021409 RepID=UPI00254F75A2|nr:nucleotidyl transferase AbiEii/AbiGii toxin family protein [Rhizobium sp. CNPSo 4039]MDK4717506.1 nucleotidyl transferase AbiEii/AbiGii toxin family protein [Rhizobium sp. CNPSo 4039]